MNKWKVLSIWLLLAVAAHAQFTTIAPSDTPSGSVGTLNSKLEFLPAGGTQPTLCTAGKQVWLDGSTPPKWYLCTATNTYTEILSAGQSYANPAWITSLAYAKITGVPSFLLLSSLSGTAPISYNSSTGVFSCIAVTGSVAGCLSAADWTAFNAKQAAISGAPGTWPSFAAVATSGSASDLSGKLPVAGRQSAVNAQTGTTYTVLDSDRGKLVTHTNASAIAITLPQAGAGAAFIAGWLADVQNRGAGTATITPTTSTIDGAATLALTTGQGVRIFSDGTNYFTQRGVGGGGAGSTNPLAGAGTGTTGVATPYCTHGTVSLSSGNFTYPGGTVAADASNPTQEFVIITSIPTTTRYVSTQIGESTIFSTASGTVTSLFGSLGRPGATTNDELLPQTPLMKSSGNAWFAVDRPQPPVVAGGTYSIVFALRLNTSAADKISALTAGVADYEVCAYAGR